MTNKINVLIFPSGSEIGLEIYDSLKYNIHFDIYGMTSRDDHSKYLYDNEKLFVGNYNILNSDFLEVFNGIIAKHNIEYVFPTHDSIAEYLTVHQYEISATIIGSNCTTARIARSKLFTYEMLKEFCFMPKIYLNKDNIDEYPVFVKPDKGQGGKGTKLIHCKAELEMFFNNNKNVSYIISEYLVGDELSVDCFNDKTGKLLFAGVRTRERVTIGISFRSKVLDTYDELWNIAQCIAFKLKIRGAWFFQVKANQNGKYKFMEFAVRQASTMGLYRQKGVNFAALSLFDAMDLPVEILVNDFHIELDRRLKSSYSLDYDYNYVYIDFDETIILDGKVNSIAIRFLYQCSNKNKKIILLTKHESDIFNSLKKFKLSIDLFDEIISLKTHQEKAEFINEKKAIFIDNYFFDRQNVKEKCGIAVFDVDAIESLIDETAI